MKKTLVLLLTLILILTCAGCGKTSGKAKKKKNNEPRQTQAAQVTDDSDDTDETQPTPATRPTEDPEGKIKGVNVIDAFSATEQFAVDYIGETYTCTFRIPAIDLDTANAEEFNQGIYNHAYSVYESAHDPEDDLIYNLTYVSSVYKGYVAIMTDVSYMLPASEFFGHVVETYYYDVAKDRDIGTDEGYIEAMGYTLPQLQAAAEKTQNYKDLADSGIYDGGETYDWDSVKLKGCILNFDQVHLIYECTWSFRAEGETFTNCETVVQTMDTDEFLALI